MMPPRQRSAVALVLREPLPEPLKPRLPPGSGEWRAIALGTDSPPRPTSPQSPRNLPEPDVFTILPGATTPTPEVAPPQVTIHVGGFSEEGGPAGWRLVALRDAAPSLRLQAEAEQARAEFEQLSARLADEVRERTYDLFHAHFDAIYTLALACESRIPGIGRHLRRIQHLSEAIALEAGLDASVAVEIGYSSVLHDVGKLVVSDNILRKLDALTDTERRIMRQHTVAGERMLGERPFFETARRIARSHHESWDGTGYPDGLAGETIPVAARVVALADMYDALVSERTYKEAWDADRAAAQIEALIGVRFEPTLGRAFLRLRDRGEIDDMYRHVDALHARELPPLLE
jgi:hypothetical protein